MRRRVYSLETEYALVHEPVADGAVLLPADQLYDLLEARILAQGPYAPCDPTAGRAHRNVAQLVELREGFFLSNGARVYFDTGHLEWAAPEASDPYQAITYDQAAGREIAAVAAAVASRASGRPLIVKNNLDYLSGTTYGCHENYSVRVRSDAGHNVLRQVIERMVPFLATRQLICGAGRVGATPAGPVAFQLSQRADFITCVSSVDTRESRPIVNTRDEPLANERLFARLHLILGDSNMAEYPAILKLGTTGLLLDMIEADAPLPVMALADPVGALHIVSRDLSFQARLPLRGGGAATALEVQRAYWRAARDFVAARRDDEDTRDILRIWDEVLTALGRHDDMLIESALDWGIKRRLLGGLLRQMGWNWDLLALWEPVLAYTWDTPTPRLPPAIGWGAWLRRQLSASDWQAVESWRRQHQLDWSDYPQALKVFMTVRAADLRYHDIDPDRGLFYRRGQALRALDDSEIDRARRLPPDDTRAAVRSYALSRAAQQHTELRMDWHCIYVVAHERVIALDDPLASDHAPVDAAFPHLPTPPDNDAIEIVVLNVEDLDNDE